MNELYFSFLSYFQIQDKEYRIQRIKNKIVKYKNYNKDTKCKKKCRTQQNKLIID